MIALHPEYIINKKDEKKSVILPFNEWEVLIAELEGFDKNYNQLIVPEWQKVELDKRYADYKTGNIKLHDWKDIHYGLTRKIK